MPSREAPRRNTRQQVAREAELQPSLGSGPRSEATEAAAVAISGTHESSRLFVAGVVQERSEERNVQAKIPSWSVCSRAERPG